MEMCMLFLFVCVRRGLGSGKTTVITERCGWSETYSRMEEIMEKRIAIMGIIIEDTESVERVNELLHAYRDVIIGRMGMPYRERGISVISIVMDADTNTVSALSGKLGMTPGVSAKAVYSKK